MVTRLRVRQESRSMEVFTRAVRTEKVWTFSPTSSVYVSSCRPGASATTPSPSATREIRCIGFLLPPPTMPPRKKDMPSTRRRFERMEPRSVLFTNRMRWPRSDWTMMTTSTALPNVAFSRPASMSFFRPAASSSVASPRIFARGMRAKKLSTNVTTSPLIPVSRRRISSSRTWTTTSPKPPCSDQSPRGKHISSQDSGCFSMLIRPWPSTLGGLGMEVPLIMREVLIVCLPFASAVGAEASPKSLFPSIAPLPDRPRAGGARSCTRGRGGGE
mmetsp:Transcript_142426/g.442881  ORF Transcript_142426/g.442881 Transcript_142426/m.442881 type:complete len:273 (+) Transcript_142426:835-1653(+)